MKVYVISNYNVVKKLHFIILVVSQFIKDTTPQHPAVIH